MPPSYKPTWTIVSWDAQIVLKRGPSPIQLLHEPSQLRLAQLGFYSGFLYVLVIHMSRHSDYHAQGIINKYQPYKQQP